jgi:hypothetical protein
MVYFSGAGSAMIRMDAIKSSDRSRAWWVNPVDGGRRLIGEFGYGEFREFATPADWEDAVLLLEGS